MKHLWITTVLVILLSNLACSQTKELDIQRLKKARVELRKYGFCACLNKKYPQYDSLLNDGSASGYFELSDYNILALEAVDSLARTLKAEKNPSKHNVNLGIMSCLNFYESDLLKEFVKRQDINLSYPRKEEEAPE